jgi:serine/threonine protein kinase
MSFLEYVGRYRIRQPLGQGGMATVYLAHDPNTNRDVAVKVLSAALTADLPHASSAKPKSSPRWNMKPSCRSTTSAWSMTSPTW